MKFSPLIPLVFLIACADMVTTIPTVTYSTIDNSFPSIKTGIVIEGELTNQSPFPSVETGIVVNHQHSLTTQGLLLSTRQSIVIEGELTNQSPFPSVETGIVVNHPLF